MDVLAVEERLAVQRKLLCGREEEIALLEDALKEPCQEEGTIYYFYGRSGVGKSKLCEYARLLSQKVQENIPKDHVRKLLHLDVTEESGEAQTVRRLYRELACSSPRFTFPRYETANRYLFELTKKAEYQMDWAAGNGRLLRMGSSLSSMALGLLGVDLPIGAAEQFVKEQLCQERMDDLRAIMEPLICEWDRWSEPEIRACLTSYFVDDLNDSLSDISAFTEKEHHLIITLDAFEKRPQSNGKDWFLDKLLPKLKKHYGLSLALMRNFPLSGDGRAAFSPMK